MESTLVEYGERQLHFDPDTHQYWLDQTELLSVTKYLKMAGYCRPYNGDGTAAEMGRHTHLATYMEDHQRLDWKTLDEHLAGKVRAWQQFKKQEEFQPDLLLRERPCYHPIYLYAGTPDAPGMRHGKPCVVEIKGGAPEPWHALQLAGGYKPMIAQHYPQYAKADLLLVYLKADGSFKVVPVAPKQTEQLFASLVATVNGRDHYGNFG